TTGFADLQWSKIRRMGVEKDFLEVHVVDPDTSSLIKKDVFADILQRKSYDASEVLVVGDDPASEIKAAKELGIDTALMDKEQQHPSPDCTVKVANFRELREWIKNQ